MTKPRDSAVAALMIEALEAAATESAAAPTALVSVSLEMLGEADMGNIKTAISRKTRTLLFATAELVTDAGVRVASATSVHKILG